MHLTRTLCYTPADGGPERSIVVSIGSPVEDGDETWWAPLEVVGFDDDFRTKIPGVDSLHAVLDAAGVAKGYLEGKARRGRLTLNGSDDLGFRLAGSD